LLLVTQARLLIGKPLLEALEALLPADVGKAIVDFGPRTGFALTADRLKQLSAAAPRASGAEAPAPAVAEIVTASDAAGAIQSVEAYFRQSERSSPVPMLLQRARTYLDKDFQSLVDELIPKPRPE
jgi:type VI secretion system protein ImpA